MQVEISVEERALLEDLLISALRHLQVETRRTDSLEFKAGLRERQHRFEALARKLEVHHPLVEATP